MNRGVLYALGAYFIWGVLPVYWKALIEVPATQILAQRVIWSVFFLGLLILLRRELGKLRSALAVPGRISVVFLAACLLGINWLTYIWGVNAGFIVETSLGYFINPLVSVLLGVIFLHERLRTWQWIPVGLATFGVVFITFSYGRLPWISLVLAFSFGFYGLVKKTSPLESRYGLTLETGMMVEVPSAVVLARELAKEADFFSIGTNDLTQYALAMDRGHPMLARRADGLHPAVLRLIDQTVQAVTTEGKWVGVCGGIAGDPKGAVILVGLGVTELSISIPSIAAIKARLRNMTLKKAQDVAQQALACRNAAEVRNLTYP